MLTGVYAAYKKNGEPYYRASLGFQGKHISLGSYTSEEDANKAYLMGCEVLNHTDWRIENFPPNCILPFHKWVVLINVRDNKIYFKNPIYLKKRYFLYYLDQETLFKFDADDLFYYAHHKILKRGGHLFVSDYGMQVNIMSRYGIKNYAVCGKDYVHINGDTSDFRYSNIEIINRYYGVSKVFKKGIPEYLAKIHINGNYKIGHYRTETEAAIAYNKTVNILQEKGLTKNFPQNYIDELNEITYASLYQRIRISKRLLAYADRLNNDTC